MLFMLRPNVAKYRVYQFFFYVDEKFTHQVIYFNTKSYIFLCQVENLYIKFITLLSVTNFFKRKYIFVDQVSCFDIRFLIFVLNIIFPLPSPATSWKE